MDVCSKVYPNSFAANQLLLTSIFDIGYIIVKWKTTHMHAHIINIAWDYEYMHAGISS